MLQAPLYQCFWHDLTRVGTGCRRWKLAGVTGLEPATSAVDKATGRLLTGAPDELVRKADGSLRTAFII